MTTTVAAPFGFSFRRTVLSHGWFALPPFHFDREAFVLRRVLRLPSGRLAEVRLSEGTIPAEIRIEGLGARGRADVEAARAQIRHILRLDESYDRFYEATAAHPAFAWIASSGAGRLLRAPTVFEDLVKLICTTNCTWSLTEVMVGNLVASLGEPVAKGGPRGFPTPEAMARVPVRFYEKTVRAGYRSGALAALAERVASGELDVEGWLDPSVPTEELSRRILSVRGAGPYTAENLLKLLGRYEGLAIDSWCRAKYLRMYPRAGARPAWGAGRRAGKTARGGRAVPAARIDASMRRRYARFGEWRGLALWCDLTKDWLEGESPPGGAGDKF